MAVIAVLLIFVALVFIASQLASGLALLLFRLLKR